uniref:Uncharacterized protein n=1 Tax=Dunaliella tertiolecta TaxID=3047 RepID=A0A7S3QRT6_DUNTE
MRTNNVGLNLAAELRPGKVGYLGAAEPGLGSLDLPPPCRLDKLVLEDLGPWERLDRLLEEPPLFKAGSGVVAMAWLSTGARLNAGRALAGLVRGVALGGIGATGVEGVESLWPAPWVSMLCFARPRSTFLALDANSREHLVSGTFSAAGLTFTTSTHLLLAPRESSNKRVSLLFRKGMCPLRCCSAWMTSPKALSDLLMFCASFKRSPCVVTPTSFTRAHQKRH